MRIKNKYLRNRAYRAKHWNRIRRQSHPYETFMPYSIDVASNHYWVRKWTAEEQVNANFEYITEKARCIENGTHRGGNHAPKYFRKILNANRKAIEKNCMSKIRQGNYEAEFPKFKRDADWLYF